MCKYFYNVVHLTCGKEASRLFARHMVVKVLAVEAVASSCTVVTSGIEVSGTILNRYFKHLHC